MPGVDDSGFTLKTYQELIEEAFERLRDKFGANIDLELGSPLRKIVEVYMVEASLIWQQLDQVYLSSYLETAYGTHLDRVVALIGVTRKEATAASGEVTFSITTPKGVNVTIPVGTTLSTQPDSEGNTIQFDTAEEKILEAGQTSIDVPIVAVEKGTNGIVAADTIVVIIDPISGLPDATVTNTEATIGGTNEELDEALRTRAKDALIVIGKGTVIAIKGAVLAVEGVTDVGTEEDLVGHTLHLTVSGNPDSDDVDAAIEDTRPAGIEVTWAAPTPVDIYVDCEFVETETEPATIAEVKTTIVDFINALGVGKDAIYDQLTATIMNVDGVYDIGHLYIGTAPSPTGTANITIAADEKAQTEDAKVDVTSTAFPGY